MHIYEGHEVKNSSVVLLGDYRSLEKENAQLEADKLEAYRAISDNCIAEYHDSTDYCIYCEKVQGSKEEHNKHCIVLKAEEYINETHISI